MLFRSKKTQKHSRQRSDSRRKQFDRRLCRLEPLESRRLLSAFDLASYDLNISSTLLGNATELSGVAYSDVTDTFYVVDDGTQSKMLEYSPDGALLRTIDFDNFNDLEGIVHMGGTRFAVLEEDTQGAANGFNFSFHLNILTIPTTLEVTIDKNDLTQSLPNEGTIVMTHADLDEGGDDNSGPEGVAYDADGGYFYVAKEKDSVRLWRFDDDVATAVMKVVDIPGVTDNPSQQNRLIDDISEIYFTDDVGGAGGRLFLMSDPSQKIIMADVDDSNPNALSAAVVKSGGVPVEIDVSMTKPEGFSFTSDSFILFTVADQDSRPFKQYRNFTALTPAAAPDLDAASDTGVDNNNITQDDTPTFSGTLTRGIFEDSVPVKDAWVWLYADDGSGPVKTGSPDQVDANGNYTVTAAPLDDDTYDFTIRASATNVFDEDTFSFDSPALEVTIQFSDLTDNGYVDFQDLTILLANWNK
ncbi:MAG: SdiA-regulated domain-containing protein, partial [Planctomycetes bacterium]|nr:SdiA-regulated domain-containing protein [Planctomycetota bacterium]